METLKEYIKRHEGTKLKPYPCPTGHMTIGVGHNLEIDLPHDIAEYLYAHLEITEAMAEEVLDLDIAEAERVAEILFYNFAELTENRKKVFVDLCFNMGMRRTSKWRGLRKAVRKNDWELAADELMWHNGVTKDYLSDYFTQVKGRAIENIKMIREG